MKRRFVISTDNLTAEQERLLKTELGSVHWWHWLPNTWLAVDYTDTVTTATLRDAVRKINPTAQCLVLEVTPTNWASMERRNAHGVLSDWVTSTFI